MPYHKAMSSVIRQRPDFHTLSSSEVLDEFVAMRILDKTADNAVLHSQRAKKPNLALKAKVSVEEEFSRSHSEIMGARIRMTIGASANTSRQ